MTRLIDILMHRIGDDTTVYTTLYWYWYTRKDHEC
jgi:hypothetical protein